MARRKRTAGTVIVPNMPDVGDISVSVYDDHEKMIDERVFRAVEYKKAWRFYFKHKNADLFIYKGWEARESKREKWNKLYNSRKEAK